MSLGLIFNFQIILNQQSETDKFKSDVARNKTLRLGGGAGSFLLSDSRIPPPFKSVRFRVKVDSGITFRDPVRQGSI